MTALDDLLTVQSDDIKPSLAAHSFTDMYISSDPGQIPVARNLELPSGERFQGVTDIPATLHGEIASLAEKADGRLRDLGETEFTLRLDGVFYRFALITAPAARPEAYLSERRDWCVRRIGGIAPDLDQLGLPEAVSREIQEAGRERGLVIIAGPFGSGKTTTASSALVNWVQANRESAVTFKDPPEFPIAGRYSGGGIIHQVPVSHGTLAGAIVNSRRWAPRYIFLGEIKTPEAAAELLHMSISGPLSLCTLHASDPVQAIASLARFAGSAIGDVEARRMTAASLRLVITQDLSWGHMIARKAVFPARGAEPLRAKIEAGRFNMIYEDIERQERSSR